MNADSAFWRLRRVSEETSLSKSSIYRLVGEGTFPRPIKLGEAATAWIEAEVRQWMATRIQASRSQPHPARTARG